MCSYINLWMAQSPERVGCLWKPKEDFIQMKMQSSLLHLNVHVTTHFSGQHVNGNGIYQCSHQGRFSVRMSLLPLVKPVLTDQIMHLAKSDQFYDNLIISFRKTRKHCKPGTWTGVKQLFGHCVGFLS